MTNRNFFLRKYMNAQQRQEIISQVGLGLEALTPSQLSLVLNVVEQLATKTVGYRNPESDFITEAGLNHIGDAILAHHSMAQRPLSKESFEHALEGALIKAGHVAKLAKRGNPGQDMTVDGVAVSLKTQGDATIKPDELFISKWMELGSGEWDLPQLRDQFLNHLNNYSRVFQFRCHRQGATGFLYELVEIPMALLREAEHATLEFSPRSKTAIQGGYGRVVDPAGRLKFALYFDGAAERKLQLKYLRKDLCIVHATWSFDSAAST